VTSQLHRKFSDLHDALPRVPLGSGPTPVRRLDGLAGTEVWLKDDGAYGDGAWGGNKVRKLEWILGEAGRRGASTILTFGALGTNHGLATALYGREHGLRVVLALVDQPVDGHVAAQLERLETSGAVIHRTRTKARTVAALPWLLARYRRPYLLPAGGSSPVGALGYVEAALEIAGQVEAGAIPPPACVVVAMGSGGTAAGLMAGLALGGLQARVLGVVVNDSLPLDERTITRLATRTTRLLRRRGARAPFPLAPLEVTRSQLGSGYGHPTEQSRAAAALARERCGLALDPVYTAKAMAAVLELGERDGPVLFLNTHGPR
jgi:D-cysteine desulfhydrase